MNRAYSTFELKNFDDDRREITGIASTPAPDRVGDVVDPKGAQFKLPIPFLWQHDHSQPIGHVTHAEVRRDGIHVEAKLAKASAAGRLKDRLDDAWQSLRLRLVRGLSIGFRPLEIEPFESGYRFEKWEWLELSAVTIPANADASIQTIKRYDAGLATVGDALVSMSDSERANRVNACLKKARATRRDFSDRQFLLMTSAEVSFLKEIIVRNNSRYHDVLTRLEDRIVQLEQRFADAKSLAYRGTWRHDDVYEPGDFVTHSGSTWACKKPCKSMAPGKSGHWQLAVKSTSRRRR